MRSLLSLAPALAMSVLTTLAVVGPARAIASDDLHNIPGVPLPSPNVSGQLGGPIYDVVYRVVVPPGHVLLAAMTGEPGTDFDLYLFDSSATDIYADPPVGLVVSSTGPTSTESISYPSIGGGTFYLDLSGASKVEGAYHLAVQVLADTTPPRVTLSLDGGAPATNTTTVAVTVVASDDLSGVNSMQLSTDGVTWQDWQAYTPALSWKLPPGDGPKELWARVRDGAGNVSAAAHATIDLITTPPVVIARDPDPGSPYTGPLPTIRIRFSEPIRLSSWTNHGLLLQSDSGTVIYGTYAWDPSTNTGSFTPYSPLVPGATYTVSLGSVVDEAGNPLAPIGSWVIHPLLVPGVTVTASSRLVTVGTMVAVSGRVVGGADVQLNLERSVGGGPWVSFATTFPAPDGSFSAPTLVDANTSFRAVAPATPLTAEATSPPARVLVRRQVNAAGLDPFTTRRVTAGSRVRVIALVGPTDPPVQVTFSLYRYVVGRGYVLQASLTRTAVGGRYTFSWTATRAAYYVRLGAAPSPLYANAVSPIYRFVGY